MALKNEYGARLISPFLDIVVTQPIGPGDIADTEGHLASTYGATDRTLVLIRPDGYIALISDAGDVSAVSDYLAAIG